MMFFFKKKKQILYAKILGHYKNDLRIVISPLSEEILPIFMST